MDPKPESNEDDQRDSTVRFICGVLAVLMAAVTVFTLFGGLSRILTDGLSVARRADFWGPWPATITARPTLAQRHLPSAPDLGILAICVLPPLVLFFLFGDRPGWTQPLVVVFLLSISLGPFLLLRPYTGSQPNPKTTTTSDARMAYRI